MALPPAPWDNQIFTFGWFPYTNTIGRCDTLSFSWDDNPHGSSPNTTAPYQLLIYSGLGQPLSFDLGYGNGGIWPITIPAGNSYMFAMKDAHGFSGGVTQIVTVERGLAACNTTSFPPNTLDYEMISDSTPQCGKMLFVVKEGVPPYKLEILPEDHYPKTLNFSTEVLEYVIDLQSNSKFFAVISDSSGRVSMQGLTVVGPSTDASCVTAAPIVTSGIGTPTTYSVPLSATDGVGSSSSSSSSSHLGAIVGGTIGGIALLLLTAIAWVLLRRRRRRSHVRESDNYDLTSPVDHREHFFPDPSTHATPWTPDPDRPGHSQRMSSSTVPLMREVRLKSPPRTRPNSTRENSYMPQADNLVESEGSASSPNQTLMIHNDGESSSAVPRGSQTRRSQKLTSSSIPSTPSTPAPQQQHHNVPILTEEDVGVAIPPPPIYTER